MNLSIRLMPAFLSMILPGLGQFVRGRWRWGLIFLILYVLSILMPLRYLLQMQEIIPESAFGEGTSIVSFILLLPFPVLVLFCSILDAGCADSERPFFVVFPCFKVLLWIVIFCFAMGLLFPHLAGVSQKETRRTMCINRMKHIVLGMLIYREAFGTFPPAWTTDAQGKPLHSWRVLLLPYIGEDDSSPYREIRLNEPWDSEYNRRFHVMTPAVYQCPSLTNRGPMRYLEKRYHLRPDMEKLCCYSVIVGEGTAFPGAKSISLNEDTNPENTKPAEQIVMLVERLLPVCWMDPNQEIDYETVCEGINRKLRGTGSVHSGNGAFFGMSDGSVRFISGGIDERILKVLPKRELSPSDQGVK